MSDYHSIDYYFVFLYILNVCDGKYVELLSLPVVLYAAHAWFLTPWEEQRLRLFEDKVLRRIFKPKKEGVIGCRKLHEEELHNLYSSLYVLMMWRLIKH
jgi:hypothetical protein